MVCRSTFGNSAITSWATQNSGLREVQVLSLFHEVRNDVPRDTPAPSREEYHAFLTTMRDQVLADPDLTPRRAASIARRLEDGMAQAPDGRTYYAWRTISERATRARAAMDSHFAEIAHRHGQSPTEVEAAFNRVADINRDAGRGAPQAPAVVAFDDTNIPHDRATRYALMCVYSAGAAAASDTDGEQVRTEALERAEQDAQNAQNAQNTCPNCGQFTGDDTHTCPTSASTTPGIAELRARVQEDGNGGFIASDGRTFGSRVHAMHHERQLSLIAREAPGSRARAVLEASTDAGLTGLTTSGLVAARDAVQTHADDVHETTDGHRFEGRVEAMRHQRNLNLIAEAAAAPAQPIGLREAATRVTAAPDGTFTTTDGHVFSSRVQAAQHERGASMVPGNTPEADDAATNCPNCGQFAGPNHTCPTPVTANTPTERDPNLDNGVTRNSYGMYVATDGTQFTSWIDAVAHQRHRDARTRTGLRRAPDGGFVVSDGSRFNGEADAAVYQAGLDEAMAGRRSRNEAASLTSDEALAALRERLVGPVTPSTPVARCENCGEFTGDRHVCAENADGEPRYVYDEHGVATLEGSDDVYESTFDARPVRPGADDPWAVTEADEGIPEWERALLSGEAAAADAPVVDRPAAPAAAPRERQRTPLRTYNSGDATVNMVNLSQVRADLRRVGVGEHVDMENVSVAISEPYIDSYGNERIRSFAVTGRPTVTATSARARRGVDRLQVHAHDGDLRPATERTLRCTCPRYRDYYRCEHTRQAVEHVQALLNNRDAVAVAPQAAVDEARAELRSEFQDSLTAQEQARTDFAATNSGVSYAQDMAAFQADWDAAKARIESGDTTLTYMTENATGGLGARVGGRSFGIEIEVDFPDDMSYTAKNRVAREIYEAGLSQGPQVRGWHWVGRAGGGYTDAPNNWAVEFDRSVDDVGGNRGCEIVSPILYDEPHTWENLAKVCEIIQRNGGRATRRTGLHINVGAADYDHTVENHNRLLNLSTSYEDVLVRVSHNPEASPNHRGREYCTTSQIPASGYRRIRDAQLSNGHRSMVNLDHVPHEGQNVTSSTRVEVRIFDGTVDPGRMQADVKVALGLVNAATRGVEPTQEAEPVGTHRRSNVGANGRMRRLSGDAWTNDTASFRAFADAIFSRAEDKAQLVQAFAASRWQAR